MILKDKIGLSIGVNYITPNDHELRIIIGNYASESDLVNKCRSLINQLKIDGLLVTRSEKGVLLVTNEIIYSSSVDTKLVFDVSGAGDSVIATFTTYLNERSIVDSAEISNIAGSIVVSQPGTSAIKKDVLEDAIKENKNRCTDSILKINKSILLPEIRRNKKIVFTNGCFDLLHEGHIFLLSQCKKFGDIFDSRSQ